MTLPANYNKLFKFMLGLTLFLSAVFQVDYTKTILHLEHCNFLYLAGALLITMVSILTRLTIRKHLLDVFSKTSFSVVFKTFLSTSYLTNLLPARLGGLLGEPWAFYSFSRKKIKFNDAMAFCLITTSSQNIRKIIISMVGLIWFFSLFPGYYSLLIILAVLLYTGYTATILYAVFSFKKIPGTIEKFKRFIPKKTASFLISISDIGRQTASRIKFFFVQKKIVLPQLVMLLIISTLFESFRIWLLLLSFGVQFNFLYLLLIPSLAYSVTALPISIGGFGVTEVSGLLVFKSFGIEPEIALSVVFLDRALSTYWNFLIGAFLIPFIKLPRRQDFSGSDINELLPHMENK